MPEKNMNFMTAIQNKSLALLLLILFGACQKAKVTEQHTAVPKTVQQLSEPGTNATNPYFTHDHLGQPVLCWTEALSDAEGFVLKYTTFNPSTKAFGEVHTVMPSRGTVVHPENMNKVAFTSEGIVVAVYSRKHPTPENRFAGSLWYSQSFDGGKTWTEEAYLHSDTSKNVGRGYFDLAMLPDGEVGAVWLDGRYGKASTGSALFFAKTERGKGFGKDKEIGESTCECCRTDLYVDQEGRIHVVYRDILNDSIRDIVHQFSEDKGQSFSGPRRISNDNWVIHGCPHTGPSLASTSQGLHALWFTAGGTPAVYFTSTADQGKSFSVRSKISEKAKHPQMIALPDGRLVMVWDEPVEDQQAAHHSGHAASSGNSRIVRQIRKGNITVDTQVISDPGSNASYPVVAQYDGYCVAAWSQTSGQGAAIFYQGLDLN